MLKNIKIFILTLGLLGTTKANAQQKNDSGNLPKPNWATETANQKQIRMQWWKDAHFGMFIHWGLYSVAARHEWVKNREKMDDKAYEKYFEAFDPDLYDPAQWAKAAKMAGMKYVVITTKHHEGFALWDSQVTDYKATNTPAKRDLLKPFVDAFRAEGIKVGLYYSLLDWHHPDFPIDRNHPMRDNAAARADKKRDIRVYQKYMKDQITELLTNYGQIDELFLDYSYPGPDGKGRADWDSVNLLALIRKLQPNIIVNDRLDLDETSWGWDYKTPEQFMPEKWPEINGVKVPWETCQTFSGSWGYFRDEYSWKSPHQLIAMLIETVSKGGNLLLNVGPTSRGTFDSRATDRLKAIGEWMDFNSKAIYNCTEAPAEFQKPNNCLLTYNPKSKRIYIHLLDWPFKSLHLQGFSGKIKYAQLLNDGSEIVFKEEVKPRDHTTETTNAGEVLLELPVRKPDVEIPVIEIILK